jgi:hypothetical protein
MHINFPLDTVAVIKMPGVVCCYTELPPRQPACTHDSCCPCKSVCRIHTHTAAASCTAGNFHSPRTHSGGCWRHWLCAQ